MVSLSYKISIETWTHAFSYVSNQLCFYFISNLIPADYKYLFDGCCRGKAKAVKALGDMSHAKCLSECKKESKCIALETNGWNKKSGQYGFCKLFERNPDSRQKEITNGGCDSSGNTKCYGKVDEKGCIKILMYRNTYIHIF